MLEKGSWSLTPEGVFSSCDSDSCKEVKRFSSDDTGMSDHCFKSSNIDCGGSELCADDTILGDKCVVEDDSVCQYPINHTSQADNELSFLDNCGWLDIGNFEDVDRMLMLSCDLTFGMESLNNEEFSWLSSSHGAEGSDDASKSDFKFSSPEMGQLKSILDYDMDSKENIEGLPINDSTKKAYPVDKNVRSQMDVVDDGVSDPLLMFNDSDVESSDKVDLVPKEKLQRKLQKASSGRQKTGYLENGDSIHPYTLQKHADRKQPFEASSSGVTSLNSSQDHKLSMDSDSLGCIQTQTPILHPDYSHAPNHTSVFPCLFGSRSEHDGHLSASLKESSYGSSIESCHGHSSLEAASLKTNNERENLYYCHHGHMSSRSFKNEKTANQMPFRSPSSAQQIGHQFENENENESHSEVCGVSLGVSTEIDSSTVQESSSMSSALDRTSVEATSFCQLQQVMDQLDIRTKLCIRDSLYRLAMSAEQRHNDSNKNGCIGDDVELDAGKAVMAQDASRCLGFVDMETDTNPIDRSVAHLLFHRPSDPSKLVPNDVPFKTSGMLTDTCIGDQSTSKD